ncbi:hypothetical protein [uncultured Roseivirga sp.]|uniref:hypothetical protein n=1 Tax=uncultured Roseivirga sp. TaxID=543088 RepID=UPI0030D74B80|tara:strand:- start:3728 stop:4213 length:486 start_codon:yes stop_codon:yes gene_type:complete
MSTIFKHSSEVLDALDNLPQVNYSLLSHDDSREALAKLLGSFTQEGVYKYPIWENLTDFVSVQYEYAWEWFGEMLVDREVLLLFEPEDDWQVFKFSNGADLVDVFNNCYSFVFYITTESNNSLICFNDHNFLIASGDAKKWLVNFETVKENKLILNTNKND